MEELKMVKLLWIDCYDSYLPMAQSLAMFQSTELLHCV